MIVTLHVVVPWLTHLLQDQAWPVSIEPDRSGARKRREKKEEGEIGGEALGTEAELFLRQVGLGGRGGVVPTNQPLLSGNSVPGVSVLANTC